MLNREYMRFVCFDLNSFFHRRLALLQFQIPATDSDSNRLTRQVADLYSVSYTANESLSSVPCRCGLQLRTPHPRQVHVGGACASGSVEASELAASQRSSRARERCIASGSPHERSESNTAQAASGWNHFTSLCLSAARAVRYSPANCSVAGTRCPRLRKGATSRTGAHRGVEPDSSRLTGFIRVLSNSNPPTLLILNLVPVEVIGCEICSFQKSTKPDQIFILARILFLATVSPSPFITTLVEEKRQGHLSTSPETYSPHFVAFRYQGGHGAGGGTKVLDDSGVLSWIRVLFANCNLIKISSQHPPTCIPPRPPRAVHNISAPVAAPLTHFGTPPVSGSSSPNVAPPPHYSSSSHCPRGPGTPPPHSAGVVMAVPAFPSARAPRRTRHPSPARSTAHYPSSLSRSPSPIPVAGDGKDKDKSIATPDTLLRAQDLLAVALAHCFPNAVEADDAPVRERIKAQLADALDDDKLSPLVALLTRLCAGDADACTHTCEWLLLDRSAATGALESRPDTLGCVLGLMGSVCHPRLKDSVGEMLYAMCDGDTGIYDEDIGGGVGLDLDGKEEGENTTAQALEFLLLLHVHFLFADFASHPTYIHSWFYSSILIVAVTYLAMRTLILIVIGVV
ncbi:hypothetical protein B0H11DRAFT_2211016 [Mycena galericulata]|nr:hypothetical protein B0H11DRAFT_2211016 [Mycena galericulata]